jgi:Uma2 family endonuclease
LGINPRNAPRILDNAFADRPCEVYINDVKVQVQPRRKYFYPDVVVTSDERDRQDSNFVAFPCLTIEVLSPSTESLIVASSFLSTVNLRHCKNMY